MNDPYDNTQFHLEESMRQLAWLKEQLKDLPLYIYPDNPQDEPANIVNCMHIEIQGQQRRIDQLNKKVWRLEKQVTQLKSIIEQIQQVSLLVIEKE
mgnify:FL=1